LLWGCTATLRRHDGLALGSVFERVAYERTLPDVMREGWSVALFASVGRRVRSPDRLILPSPFTLPRLSPMRVYSVATRLDLSSVPLARTTPLLDDAATRDFALAALARVVNTPARNALVVDTWQRLAGPRAATPTHTLTRTQSHTCTLSHTRRSARTHMHAHTYTHISIHPTQAKESTPW
jgi:ATP-dependent helicase IRC3